MVMGDAFIKVNIETSLDIPGFYKNNLRNETISKIQFALLLETSPPTILLAFAEEA